MKTKSGFANAEKAEIKKERKREKRKLTIAVLLIFLTVYIVLSLIVTLIFRLSFRSGSKAQVMYDVRTVKYVQRSNGTYKKTVLANMDSETSYMGYGLYIGFDELNELCGFSVAGNGEKLTLIIRDTDEYAELFANSSFLYVNGNPVRLSSPVLNKKGKYYIPMGFVEEYVIGVDVEYDEKNELCTVSTGEKKIPIGFKLKFQSSIPSPNIKTDISGEEN